MPQLLFAAASTAAPGERHCLCFSVPRGYLLLNLSWWSASSCWTHMECLTCLRRHLLALARQRVFSGRCQHRQSDFGTSSADAFRLRMSLTRRLCTLMCKATSFGQRSVPISTFDSRPYCIACNYTSGKRELTLRGFRRPSCFLTDSAASESP
eukprot:1865883-Amphidinium_carterae.1